MKSATVRNAAVATILVGSVYVFTVLTAAFVLTMSSSPGSPRTDFDRWRDIFASEMRYLENELIAEPAAMLGISPTIAAIAIMPGVLVLTPIDIALRITRVVFEELWEAMPSSIAAIPAAMWTSFAGHAALDLSALGYFVASSVHALAIVAMAACLMYIVAWRGVAGRRAIAELLALGFAAIASGNALASVFVVHKLYGRVCPAKLGLPSPLVYVAPALLWVAAFAQPSAWTLATLAAIYVANAPVEISPGHAPDAALLFLVAASWVYSAVSHVHLTAAVLLTAFAARTLARSELLRSACAAVESAMRPSAETPSS